MSDLPVGLRIAQQNQIQLPQSEADAVDVQGKDEGEQSPQFAETPDRAPEGQSLTTIDAISAESSAKVVALLVGQQQEAPKVQSPSVSFVNTAGEESWVDYYAQMNPSKAAGILSGMEPGDAARILSQKFAWGAVARILSQGDPKVVAGILSQMKHGDAAGILSGMEPGDADIILSAMAPKKAAEIRNLM